MDELTVFENPQFGQVRTLEIDGEPWFVAVDVCRALKIDRTQVRRLDSDEKGMRLIHTLGGEQNMTIVNEPGLYSLVLSSRKPEAKAFKRWITHEVIPAIRKTGAYRVPGSEEETITINPRALAMIVGVTVAECMKRIPFYFNRFNEAWENEKIYKPDKRLFTMRFNHLLAERHMSDADAARKLGKSRTSVHYWTSGKYCPNPENLQLIAKKMNVSINYFCEE